jgi:uncharacterized protein YndB with AHSA1/START domain
MTPTVRRHVVFPVPQSEVWQAVTDPIALAEWFANEVELDLRPGGAGVFRWRDGSERRATVELVEEERSLGFRWEDEHGQATRVRLQLDAVADGTRLTVTETPLGAQAGALAGEWGWGVELLAALPRLRRLARA